MEHSFIDEHDVISRYVAGHLPDDEAGAFEAHFMDCRSCLEKLELEQALRGGLMKVRGEWRARDAVPATPRTPRIPTSFRTLAAAAAVVVAVGTSIGYFQVRAELGRARAKLVAAQRESQEARAHAEALSRSAAAASPLPAAVAAPPSRIAVVELDSTRSDPRVAPRTGVAIQPATSLVIFSLAVGNAGDYSRFAASLDTLSGATLVRQDDLHAASPTTVAVALDASTLPPGDYTIVLEGVIRNRPSMTIARFPIRVTRR